MLTKIWALALVFATYLTLSNTAGATWVPTDVWERLEPNKIDGVSQQLVEDLWHKSRPISDVSQSAVSLPRKNTNSVAAEAYPGRVAMHQKQ